MFLLDLVADLFLAVWELTNRAKRTCRAKTTRSTGSRAFKCLYLAGAGILVGLLSIAVWKTQLIADRALWLAALIIVPLAIGSTVVHVRSAHLDRLTSFCYAAAFSFGFLLVRLLHDLGF